MSNAQYCQRWLLTMVLMIPFGPAWADWELDNAQSAINFISIKNNSAGEVHGFTSLSGFIAATGKVQIAINLNSVQTLVEVRNERMRELLFETVAFPAAQITANVDPAMLAAAVDSGVIAASVPVTLALHGHEKTMTIAVVAVGSGDGSLRVFTKRPVIVSAADFALDKGVSMLKTIAGLQSISNAIPVTFDLQFVPTQ
ncbi:MAG: YceI family protein [Halioglobus sp.]|nr:YceI family protein [Halioglobus sp.]